MPYDLAELSRMIDELKAEIEELKAKVAKLEKANIGGVTGKF